MIALSSGLSKLAIYASPPTHAALISAVVMVQPWANGLQQLQLQYAYGTYDPTNGFSLNPNVPHTFVRMPDTPTFAGAPQPVAADKLAAALGNLLAAGVAPSPAGDPTIAATRSGKEAGNFLMSDLDVIAAGLHPDLLGTVI